MGKTKKLKKQLKLKKLQLELRELEEKFQNRDEDLNELTAMSDQFTELEASQLSHDDEVIALATKRQNDAFAEAEKSRAKRAMLAKFFA